MPKHRSVSVRGVQRAGEREYDQYDTTYCHSIQNHEDFHGVNLVRDVFIETGTRQAITLKYGLHAGYKELHSIDIDPEAVRYARAHFSCLHNVHIHDGNAPDVLRRIIDPSRDTTFWLDAHTIEDCPLLAELAAIRSFKWAQLPLIVIDDTYYMGKHNWPTEKEVVRAVGPGYDCEVRGKVLFCFPRQK